jgi:hypothetical protein
MARKPKGPKSLTSTSAFRAYLREVDHLAELVAQDRLSRHRALESREALGKVLEIRLCRLFEQRLEDTPAEGADVLTIETYPVPHLRDLAEGTSYVHPARHPSTDPGGPAAGPADPLEVPADQPATAADPGGPCSCCADE